MAADDDTETEVFEITDFTTASEWERFVSRLEEVLNDWKLIGNSQRKSALKKGELSSGIWSEKSQDISFADFKFTVTHHCLERESEEERERGEEDEEEDVFPVALQDLICPNNDFPPRAHCLVRWFGLREFVVLCPGSNVEAVVSESKCNLLLSSVSIALHNSGCQVPVLVQSQQKWRRVYTGECQSPGVRVDFDTVHLHRVPAHHQNLSGLLDIFKSKIGCTASLPPVNISIRFTYILQDWQQCSWPQQPPDFDGLFAGEVGGVEFGKVPFGACAEPISELHLAATWPHLTEGIIVDNDVYSELDPLQAPNWTVRIRTVDNAQCLLGDLLLEFFRLTRCSQSMEEILGRSLTEEEGKEQDLSSALSRLTQPSASVHISKLSVTQMVHSARRHMRRRRRYEESPLSADTLTAALLFLFPDAAVEKTPEKNNSEHQSDSRETESSPALQLKAAPPDSLTHRLALCLASVTASHGGVRAVAHLWQEFILELRYRYENSYTVPGLSPGAPDLRCCLLHQKLQMLNCCIERKLARDHAHRQQSSSPSTPPPGEGGEAGAEVEGETFSDSDDEFYECVSDFPETHKPDGRLRKHPDLKLLRTNEVLYVPVTQDPSPMTEDMLEHQSEVLSKLGTSAEGAHLRARLQSACLLSDMEAFKAANPGCILEDFVRWYSPRDYVCDDEEEGAGHLSARMTLPGNMWLEAWHTAKATPTRRQKRLFDDTTEAEKVLHFLSLLKPSEVVLQLMPNLVMCALDSLTQEESSEDVPSVRKALVQARLQASRLLQQSDPDLTQLEEFLLHLMTLETDISRSRSLKAKFGVSPERAKEGEREDGEKREKEEEEGGREQREQLLQFVSALLEEPEVEVTGAAGGAAGGIIHQLFITAQRMSLSPLDPEAGSDLVQIPDFPPPAGRELILRAQVPSPSCFSRVLPQRLFCVLLKDEVRLCSAFSQDTAFF